MFLNEKGSIPFAPSIPFPPLFRPLQAGDGITVNGVAPAYVKTPMVMQQLREEQRVQVLNNIPVGRFCEPEEVAHTVRFLISPLAGFITGEVRRSGAREIGCRGGLTPPLPPLLGPTSPAFPVSSIPLRLAVSHTKLPHVFHSTLPDY